MEPGIDAGGTMNDRVVDRAAAHATPAELALRDWLLAGLSFATGVYEAIVFLTFGKVFTKWRMSSTTSSVMSFISPPTREKLG